MGDPWSWQVVHDDAWWCHHLSCWTLTIFHIISTDFCETQRKWIVLLSRFLLETPDLEPLTLLGFFAWKDGTSMSMNSPYGIFDMFDQQSVVKPKPASSLTGDFPVVCLHHSLAITWLGLFLSLLYPVVPNEFAIFFWGWILWQSLFLCPKGVELYPAQEEAIVEIFSGAHVVPWYCTGDGIPGSQQPIQNNQWFLV